MEYWIDGYNLLFKVKSHLRNLRQQRKELIDELKLHMIKSNFRAKIIFDSSEENATEFPSVSSSTPLEIIFSPKGLTADDYILEMLKSIKSTKNTTIVTDDAHLAFHCKHTQAKTLSVNAFFDLIFKEERRRHMSNYKFLEDEKIELTESEKNIQLFVKIFEDRLKHNSDEF
ncbi:MAG: NYN domain-containing protein [Simkaniaceae bacterium]|nr:NYN domain-containing protein [Simkaniaceae bacterium]MCF7852142.1 NYN domain-containing protein [Simkaniaceae bacterium]